MKRHFFAAIAACIAFIAPAGAAAITSLDDIEFWVGTGSNRAGLVIDWVDDQATTSYAWGFRWNGSATGEDMIRAIAGMIGTDTSPATPDGSGDLALTLNTVFYTGFGNTVFQLDYLAHSAGGFDDDSNGYWAYFANNNTSALPETWTYSETEGMSTRALSNNSWDAWVWNEGFASPNPPPTIPVAAAVPEPAVFALFGLGLSVLVWHTRRRHA